LPAGANFATILAISATHVANLLPDVDRIAARVLHTLTYGQLFRRREPGVAETKRRRRGFGAH
jgi:hypothetical protein